MALGFLADGEIDEFVRLQILEVASATLLIRPTKVVFSKKLGVHATTTRPVSRLEALLNAVPRLSELESRVHDYEGRLISLADDVELPDDLPSAPAAVVDALNLFPVSLSSLAASTGQEPASVLATVVGLEYCGLIETLDADGEGDEHALRLDLPTDEETEGAGVSADESPSAGPVLVAATESGLHADSEPDGEDFDVFTGDEDVGDLFGPRQPPEKEERPVSSAPPAAASADSDEDVQQRPAPPEDVLRRVDAMDRLIHDNANDYHILGIETSAAKSDVLRAFHGLCGELHPDLHQQVGDEAFHAKLGSVFARITEAFQALSRSPDERTATYGAAAGGEAAFADGLVDESQATNVIKNPERAKELFAAAKSAFIQADFWNAIELSRRAIELNDEEAEYHFVLGQALAQNPRWRQEAEQEIKTATTLAPWNAKYFVGLGELYRASGMDSRAKRLFSEAKTIDPEVKIPKDKTKATEESSSELKAFGFSLPLGRSKAG